ncbi:MAG: histidinol-phosphate transaminase, partial [Acidobacteriaceae bacterium]
MSIDPTSPALTKLRPRAAVEQMHEYHPPLAGRDGLRLDFNENTFAPSPRVQA